MTPTVRERSCFRKQPPPPARVTPIVRLVDVHGRELVMVANAVGATFPPINGVAGFRIEFPAGDTTT